MKNDKIIDKIKKLLSLSKSNNVNEAALALKRAHDLLEKYNLTLEEIGSEKRRGEIYKRSLSNIGFKLKYSQYGDYLTYEFKKLSV